MSLTREQKGFLIRVIELKTPEKTDHNNGRDYEMCYHYAAARDAARVCLDGNISYKLARKRIDPHLEKLGVTLENAVG